jgi:3-phosphoglycerate kinase
MKLFAHEHFAFLKTALVRVDYNIPIDTGHAPASGDLLRVYASLPTINKLRERGVRIILATHLGRNGDSVQGIAQYLEKPIPNIVYGTSWDPYTIRKELSNLHGSEIYMLPNVRTHPGEESNDPQFTQLLASLADVYVNDAFSNSHRLHASMVGVPQYIPGYAGYQMGREVEYLSKVLDPVQPCAVIIGGAKFDTKISLISKYLDKGCCVYVVGALAHAIYKARGYEIGVSKCDDGVDVSNLIDNSNVIVPEVVVVINSEGSVAERAMNDIRSDERVVDAGASWIRSIAPELLSMKTIVWNGPLGWYEGGFSAGTLEVIKILMQSKAYRVIGGGDTVACIPEFYEKSVADFISTGGGAMLEYLIHGTLPAIEVLS